MSDLPPARRRGRPPGTQASKRDIILAAALPVFAAHGFDGANLRQIAAAADVDVALISYQFGSKLGLWEAVIHPIGSEMLTAMRSAIETEPPSAGSARILRHALAQVADVLCDRPAFARLVVHQAPTDSVHQDYAYRRMQQPYEALLLPLVERALAEETIPEMDPVYFIFGYFCAVAMMIATRNLLVRSVASAAEDETFRYQLKRMLLARIGDTARE